MNSPVTVMMARPNRRKQSKGLEIRLLRFFTWLREFSILKVYTRTQRESTNEEKRETYQGKMVTNFEQESQLGARIPVGCGTSQSQAKHLWRGS